MTWSDYEPSGVMDVWISVNGGDCIEHTSQEGDDWMFPLPSGVTGHITVEAWAEDNARNQTYRAVILYLEDGTVKGIRWLSTGGECVMLRIERPTVEASERPTCAMMPHECRRGQYAEVL